MGAVRRRTLGVLFIVLAGCGAGAVVWLGSQLSRPAPQLVGAAPLELDARAIAFPSESGSTIHGWFSPHRRRGAVLLLPPVRANRLAMVPRAKFLSRAGYATLLIDLQGTGESPGRAITFGWRERHDVLAAVRFLREQVADEPIAIIGSSLGGAAALFATPPLHVDAMVLEAVYPSLDRAVRNRLRMRIGSASSVAAPLLLWQLQPRLGVSPSQLRPADHIRQVRCPLLIIGGAEDAHTTQADTRLLYDAAVAPKRLWLIPDAKHVDFYEAARDEYRDRVLTFLERSFAGTHTAMASSD